MLMSSRIVQNDYKKDTSLASEWMKKSKSAIENRESINLSEFALCSYANATETDMGPMMSFDPDIFTSKARIEKITSEKRRRHEIARTIIKDMFKATQVTGELKTGGVQKAGVNQGTGYNFYDLRAPVLFLFPYTTPFVNSIPRVGRINDGYGTAAHWNATRNPGYNYIGVSDGNRNRTTTPDFNPYTATYKQIGKENSVTFGAEFAGEGYTNQLADEHLRGLYSLRLGEEGMNLLGNSGTGSGNNGFALGTAVTPTIVRNTISTGGFAGSTSVSVACVYLTGMGNPANIQYGYATTPTVANGLTPTYQRQNADGSVDIIAGGISAVSAMSSVVTCDSTHQTATATVPAGVKGCFGYAWYVNTTDASAPLLSNAFLYAITQFPTVTITAVAVGTQSAAATGLSTDNSYETLDYDGLLTYTAQNGYWKDLNGGSFTAQKNGRVTEIENVLIYLYTNFQVGVDAIWGSADAVENLDAAVRWTGTSASGYQVYVKRDEQNNILGGFLVSAYQSRYATANPTGANAIPIHIHPMMPPGTLYFDISVNPYDTSRMSYVRAMLTQRDYYSIEFPVTSRTWTFGTYAHQVLQHNMPWASAAITGIGAFVQN
jgi:hypothetical protein